MYYLKEIKTGMYLGASGMCKSISDAAEFKEESLVRRFKVRKKHTFEMVAQAARVYGFDIVDCAGSFNVTEDGGIVEVKETFNFSSDDHMNCKVELYKPNGQVENLTTTFVPIRNKFKSKKYNDGTYSRIVIIPTKIVGKAVI